MGKGRHHYVPRFHLKKFKSASKRIHLFNHRSGFRLNVSLRDQCYKHRFYRNDEFEDSLADFENLVAPHLEEIEKSTIPPVKNSDAYWAVLTFISLQIVRTLSAAKRIDDMVDRMAKLIARDHPEINPDELKDLRVGFDDPVLVAMQSWPGMSESIEDLKLKLILAPDSHSFITSDNPAVRYNHYCAGIKHSGIVGSVQTGLQIFFPLSPSVMVFLYDGSVYKVGKNNKMVISETSPHDVELLNRLQIVFSDANVYFSSGGMQQELARQVGTANQYRGQGRNVIEEYPEVGSTNRSGLIHTYEFIPDLKLDLSFCSFRRSARRVPLFERAQMYRRDAPQSPEYRSANLGSRGHAARTFTSEGKIEG